LDEVFNQLSSPDNFIDFPNPSKSGFVTKRSISRKVQFSIPSPSQVETGADFASSSSNGISRLSLAATNLNESATGTPRVVLRQQINMKDETIRKLATEFDELQEYTKLESEAAVDEAREKLIEENERLKQEIERYRH
jgi:hypothetical protein